jgi:hypothetical protein
VGDARGERSSSEVLALLRLLSSGEEIEEVLCLRRPTGAYRGSDRLRLRSLLSPRLRLPLLLKLVLGLRLLRCV